jgi:biopolymer transport protein ExbB
MRWQTQFILVIAVFVLSSLFICPTVSFCADNPADLMSLAKESVENIVHPVKEVLEVSEQPDRMSMLQLIHKGGVVGYIIILLSIISIALIIDYAFTIRKGKIMPDKDISMLKELIKNPSEGEIEKIDQPNASFLSKVTIAGLKESSHGYHAMIKAMEDSAEALASGIARKTEHLNVIGNISPMMGLLGTVIGMLRCFNEIAHMTGAIEPKQLAGGIFEALITTCMGLIVAIPALYSYAIFRNRVDEYTGEACIKAEHMVSEFKTNNKGQ